MFLTNRVKYRILLSSSILKYKKKIFVCFTITNIYFLLSCSLEAFEFEKIVLLGNNKIHFQIIVE